MPILEALPHGLELLVDLVVVEVEDPAEDDGRSRLPRLAELLPGQEDPAHDAIVIGAQEMLGAAHPREIGTGDHRVPAKSGIAAIWSVESQASVDSAPWFTLAWPRSRPS